MKRAESCYIIADTQRRKDAQSLFEIANVARRIDEAASLGFRRCRIEQQCPFDLSNTDEAHTLEQWLDEHEFRYLWRPTYIEQDPLRPVTATEYPELEIYW